MNSIKQILKNHLLYLQTKGREGSWANMQGAVIEEITEDKAILSHKGRKMTVCFCSVSEDK